MDNYTDGWRRFADFRGTSSRAQYWTWILTTYVVVGVLYALIAGISQNPAILVGDLTAGGGLVLVLSLLLLLFSLVTLIPTISVTVRRLRDSGLSPWLILLALIAVLGTIVLLALCLRPSSPLVRRRTEVSAT